MKMPTLVLTERNNYTCKPIGKIYSLYKNCKPLDKINSSDMSQRALLL